ncbi:MAG: hypothetical protein LBC76_03135 [Treponema sp.]|jgi:hypothetical protein|nr:hypothetical protein [Treponema sp.]
MLAIKGRYNGVMVVLDSKPPINECDVIVNFPDIPASVKLSFEPQPSPQNVESQIRSSAFDDGSLAFLFRDYVDDNIREPIIDFGSAVGNERW